MNKEQGGSHTPGRATVVQADRDAAAAYMDRVKSTRWSFGGILSGGCDNTSIVQAFACHRERACKSLPVALDLIEALEESFTADGTYQQFLPAMRDYLAKARPEPSQPPYEEN